MPIISNTSPLLNLAIINLLHLLQQQFGQILIPSMVLEELKPDTGYPGAERIEQALRAGWFRVVELNDKNLAQALMLELDKGELVVLARYWFNLWYEAEFSWFKREDTPADTESAQQGSTGLASGDDQGIARGLPGDCQGALSQSRRACRNWQSQGPA